MSERDAIRAMFDAHQAERRAAAKLELRMLRAALLLLQAMRQKGARRWPILSG